MDFRRSVTTEAVSEQLKLDYDALSMCSLDLQNSSLYQGLSTHLSTVLVTASLALHISDYKLQA